VNSSFGPTRSSVLTADFLAITQSIPSDLKLVVDSNLLITGASGFVGKWLTLSWLSARQELNGIGRLMVVARNVDGLRQLCSIYGATNEVIYIESDIRNFEIPSEFTPQYVIHAATPASESLNNQQPQEMLSIIIDGQLNILSQSIRSGVEKFLFMSSGAVYGKQPLNVHYISEDYSGGPLPTDVRSAYHEGKRVAELMGNIQAANNKISFVTGRLFAFLAPYLPLNTHFAAGNFLLDGMTGQDISVRSDGQSIRSYQYGSDLCVFLWALLIRGRSGEAYNVGSDEAVSISNLAHQIQSTLPTASKVEILGEIDSATHTRYVPSIAKIKTELSVSNVIDLQTSIARTADWYANEMRSNS
jgi:nucleoside-diphosphate-sugar epimerase